MDGPLLILFSQSRWKMEDGTSPCIFAKCDGNMYPLHPLLILFSQSRWKMEDGTSPRVMTPTSPPIFAPHRLHNATPHPDLGQKKRQKRL